MLRFHTYRICGARGAMGSPISYNPNHHNPIFEPWSTPNHLVAATAAAALRLPSALRHKLRLGLLFRSSLQSISHPGDVSWLTDICRERPLQFNGFNCCQRSFTALSNVLMGLSFFNGDESKSDENKFGKSQSKTPRGNFFNRWKWTNILLATNIMGLKIVCEFTYSVFVAQYFSNGELLYWGAKVNSLINEGQIWRLATSSFLHANIGHLLVNCYSLNAVGPTVENMCGPRRYLAIYLTSAISSAAMSYWLCKAPAVGASGAIFGLVGSFAVFVLRHRGIVKGAEGDLKHIGQVIALNMTIGLLSQGIDNWGHVGGLIGGAAVSWLVGPAWAVKWRSRDGTAIFTDKAPIFSLIKRFPK